MGGLKSILSVPIAHIHIYICTYIYIYNIQIRMYISVCVCVSVYIDMHIYVYMRVLKYGHMLPCKRTCDCKGPKKGPFIPNTSPKSCALLSFQASAVTKYLPAVKVHEQPKVLNFWELGHERDWL